MGAKIEGKTGVGRTKFSWLRNLLDQPDQSSTELLRLTANEVQIAMSVAEIRRRIAT